MSEQAEIQYSPKLRNIKKDVAERYKNSPNLGKFGLPLGFIVGSYKATVQAPAALRGRTSILIPLGIWAKFTLFGGATGFAYDKGLYLVRQARQQHDYWNNYLMGGIVSVPFSVMRNLKPPSWLGKFVLYGTVAATLDYCMVNRKKVPGVFIEGKNAIFRTNENPCRYPMVYVFHEVVHRKIAEAAKNVMPYFHDSGEEYDDEEEAEV